MKDRRSPPLRELPDRPGTTNQLKKLGNAIRDDDAVAVHGLHYDEVFGWYNDLVVAAIEDLGAADLSARLSNPDTLTITGRAKTRTTVREKLQRRRSEKLPSIQDLAGLRIEADMALTEQDAVAAALCEWFGLKSDAIHDLRDGDHAGYRAVHVWARLNQPKGAWFEIQVRTRLQGEWANYFEALADYLGRELRYGSLPVDERLAEGVVDSQELSRVTIKQLEQHMDRAHRSSDRQGNVDSKLDPAVVDGLQTVTNALRTTTEKLRLMNQQGRPPDVELRRDLRSP